MTRPGGFPQPASPGFPRQGFGKKTCKKQQYLQGFLQKTGKNSNIYKVFCKKHAKTAVSTRFSAKTSRERGIRNEEAGFPWPENLESGDAKSKAGYRKSEISEGHRKSEIRNSATGTQKLETSNKFCNRKSEIMKPGSPNIYETCNCNEI